MKRASKTSTWLLTVSDKDIDVVADENPTTIHFGTPHEGIVYGSWDPRSPVNTASSSQIEAALDSTFPHRCVRATDSQTHSAAVSRPLTRPLVTYGSAVRDNTCYYSSNYCRIRVT